MKNKESRARFLVVFSMLLFLIILFADFYAIINYPDNFAFIIGFLVLDIVCLFGAIYGILMVKEQKEIRREEQYDSIFKSEKASYLMLRKNFEEITERLEHIEKVIASQEVTVPTEDIISSQKAVAKVVIGRSKENADAILGALDIVHEEIAEVKQSLSDVSSGVIEGQKKASEESLKEMILTLKDMEIRIHTALSQHQASAGVSVVTAAPIPSQPVVEEKPVIEEAPLLVEEEPVIEEEPLLVEEEPVIEEEPLLVEEEPVVGDEVPPMPDLSDPNKVMTPEEIAALIANI